MPGKNRIGAYQLYALFSVSLTSSLFTSPSAETPGVGPAETILLGLPFFIFCAASALPALVCLSGRKKRRVPRTVFSLCEGKPAGLRRTVSVSYAAVFLWCAALAAARLSRFMQTQLFRGDGVAALIVLFFAAAAWAASRELETLGRAAVLTGVLLAGSVLLFTGASLRYFEASELPVLWDTTPGAIARAGLLAAVRTPELLALCVLAPEVNGNVGKGFFGWLAGFALLLPVVFTVIAGVTGGFAAAQDYRFYALTGLARLGQMERLDEALGALWVLCTFLKTAFFLLLAHRSVSAVHPLQHKNLLFYILGATSCFAAILVASTEGRYLAATALPVNLALFVLFGAVLPAALAAFGERRATKKKGA